MPATKIRNWIGKVRDYIEKNLQEEPARPLSVIRHSIGVVYCYILYKTSIVDYFELRLFEKSHRERKTYFTMWEAWRFIDRINGAENNRRFSDKQYMYQVMGRFTKREQLFCPAASYQEFEAFFQRHRTAFYKPGDTYCGAGIELWSSENTDMKTLYERSRKRQAVIDEPVVQHPDLARFNPDSVNTVKIYTLRVRDSLRFIAAEFRMGRRGSPIDNFERGGLFAGIDLETGAVIGNAYDIQMKQYPVHPDTGVMIAGYTLPNWDGLLRFTEECARACPLSYVEWDIAIREQDCVLIEANPNARNSEIQMGVFHGRKKQFQELEKLYVQGGSFSYLGS